MLLLRAPRRYVGGAIPLLLVFAAKLQAQTPPGTVIRNGVTATYQAANGVTFTPASDSAFVTVGSPLGIAVTLTKSVDRASGTLGDVLTYTINYQGVGAGTATNVLVTDPLPAGATYLAGSITLDGTALTDGTGDDAGSFDTASRRVSVTLSDVTGSSAGVITFRARLDGTVSPSNVAHVAYTIAGGGPDSAASNAVVTTLTFGTISMAVLLDAPAPGVAAHGGDPVQYRVHYDNPANGVIAHDVVVTDTLPSGLEYVGSIPASPTAASAPRVAAGILTWTIGDITPGTTGDLVIKTVVAPTLTDSTTVVNRVWVNLANGPPVTSPAPAITLLPAGSGLLTLTETADVLDVGLGQTVPYTLTLKNAGAAPLADVRIVAHLAEGSRYTPKSTLGGGGGIDSSIVSGRDVSFYVASPLAAGATFTVRYQAAVVSTSSDLLQSSALAYAENGAVVSAQATAWVRIRHAYPLETRAVIGKVFIDTNGNGKQDGGERGQQGVVVWTDDGETATTDSLGRFSFSNLRPGRHAYRIDPTTLPGCRTPAQTRDGSGWTTPRVDFAVACGNVPDTAAIHRAGAGGLTPTTFLTFGPLIPALRDSAVRAGEEARALTLGPAVTFFAPRDGAVLPTDKIFVGVHGEPGASVELYDGATRIAHGRVRGDGINDFIAVPLARGPHRLRVKMENSWSQDRWDSLSVHVVGPPAKFVYEGTNVILSVDGQRVDTVYVHVFDAWNVPVVTGALVTVSADGADVLNPDAEGSSVGFQVRTDSTGVVALALRGGHDVRLGSLGLRADGAIAHLQLQILPAARAFMLTAAGQVGVGASPDAFGAATARGRLDGRTSVVVSVDSRRLDAGSETFGRQVDPLGDAQYPILGDASITGTQSASRYTVAARVERGLDWLAFGDLGTGSFAGGLTLAGYDRALPGVAGRVTTGPIVWQGFGSTRSERLAQLQIRGAGMSGPYNVALGIKPGTERVVLETRAYEDARQTLARQALTPYVDYQIDYDRGLLLFKQPVPAADPSGNPVFIMITYGAADGGTESAVWGVRASVDARGFAKARESLDSLRIGSTFIRDGRPGAERELAGIDVDVLRVGRVRLHGELAHSQTPDSAGFATSLSGAIIAKGVTVSADWLHTDPEFHNPANIAVAGGGGSNDLKVAARYQLGGRGPEFRLEHSEQSFDLQKVSRIKSGAFVVQRFGAFRAQAGLTGSRLTTAASGAAGTGDNGTDVAEATELRLVWSPLKRLDFTADARRHLGDFTGAASAAQPDYVGAGVTFKATAQTSFELTEREVQIPGGSRYAVTSLGGRSEIGAGTRAWGSYQMAGANGGQVAAVLGLNNRLQLSPTWTLTTLFERRFGLNNAPDADPIRALPFTQAEENYWSAGLGAEYLPAQAPYRLSLRSEVRNGTERSSRLFTLAGAADLTKSFAVITRQEFQGADDHLATGRINHQRLSSINGLAFRPVGTDALNFLAKVQVIDEQNPLGGGVLTGLQAGHEARRIYMADAIWSPSAWLELGGRYAFRNADATVTRPDSVVQPLRSSADYVGARLDIALSKWLRARGDSRLLHERTSATSRWDAAPQLVLVPVRGIEIANGYRFGDLSDPDFAVRGGKGWFMTLGATITEQSMSTIAGFWRARSRQ